MRSASGSCHQSRQSWPFCSHHSMVAVMYPWGVKPNVQDLLVRAVHRHGHAPVEVARHGAALEAAVDPRAALSQHVGLPFLGVVVRLAVERAVDDVFLEASLRAVPSGGTKASGLSTGVEPLRVERGERARWGSGSCRTFHIGRHRRRRDHEGQVPWMYRSARNCRLLRRRTAPRFSPQTRPCRAR